MDMKRHFGGGQGREVCAQAGKIISRDLGLGVASSDSRKAVIHPDGKTVKNIRTTVLFVEQTRGGSMAAALKRIEERLSPMLGYHIKIEEKAETKL